MDMLAEKMTPESLRTWFPDAAIAEYKDDRVILTVPHSITRDLIRDKYQKTLDDIFARIFSMPIEVVVMTEDEFHTYLQEKSAEPSYISQARWSRRFLRAR